MLPLPMKPAPFHYHAPKTIEEALATLERVAPDDGRVLACRLDQSLTPGETYRWTVPGGQSISFTPEKQPPLALESSQPAQGQERVAANTPLQLTFNAPLTAESASKVRLEGNRAPALVPQATSHADTWHYTLQEELQPDESYTLIVPAGIASIFGDKLANEQQVQFVTAPSPCPPNVYTESFAGQGHWKSNLQVDFSNAESPHTGQRAMKLTTQEHDGGLALFNGPDNQGSGRQPVDLTNYRQVEFWIKGNCDAVWIKVGHPVFDNKAFTQTHLKGVTDKYQRFTLDLPGPKTEINTVFEIGVPKDSIVYLDDIRFIGDSGAAQRNSQKVAPAAQKSK